MVVSVGHAIMLLMHFSAGTAERLIFPLKLQCILFFNSSAHKCQSLCFGLAMALGWLTAPSAVRFKAYTSCPRLQDSTSYNWNISCHIMQFKGDGSTVFWYPRKKYVPKACSANSKAEHESGCMSEGCVTLARRIRKDQNQLPTTSYWSISEEIQHSRGCNYKYDRSNDNSSFTAGWYFSTSMWYARDATTCIV